MKVRDVMSKDVVTVQPETLVRDIAALLAKHHIGGVPVVDDKGHLVGLVCQTDLAHRSELGTDTPRPWWKRIFTDSDTLARDFTKTHGLHAAQIMTRAVVTVAEDTDLGEVATLLDGNGIDRMPVLTDGKLVGIVSRTDLVEALASTGATSAANLDDAALQREIIARMEAQPWATATFLNVTVENGNVTLTGYVPTQDRRTALNVLIEATPGVRSVTDQLKIGDPARAGT